MVNYLDSVVNLNIVSYVTVNCPIHYDIHRKHTAFLLKHNCFYILQITLQTYFCKLNIWSAIIQRGKLANFCELSQRKTIYAYV